MEISICTVKEIIVPFFVHLLCIFGALCLLLIWNLFSVKNASFKSNKVFRADPNYIKEMEINWESLVIVRDKKFHVKISLLNDIFI